MKCKILLAFTFSLFLCFSTYSQVYKHRAKQLAYKSIDNYGSWTEWSDWEDCDILVVINIDNSKFTIYSQETQEFDIIKFFPKEYDKDGVEIFKMLVVDSDGIRCHIRQKFLKNDYYVAQIYVDYANLMYVYNISNN